MKIEYVVGIAFANDSQSKEPTDTVLLLKKTHPSWQAGRLNGPGGKIEAGESPVVAMIREFREETGLTWQDWKDFAIVEGADYRVYYFTSVIPWAYMRQARSAGEVLSICSCWSINCHNAIPNLTWLLPMARAQGRDISPKPSKWLYIEEKYQ